MQLWFLRRSLAPLVRAYQHCLYTAIGFAPPPPPLIMRLLKALVNIVADRVKQKKSRTVLADLHNYVQVDE